MERRALDGKGLEVPAVGMGDVASLKDAGQISRSWRLESDNKSYVNPALRGKSAIATECCVIWMMTTQLIHTLLTFPAKPRQRHFHYRTQPSNGPASLI
jgi:hypothetical protein